MLFSMLLEKKMTIFRACKSLFQFNTITMIIFCARKNLLNIKKSLKGYQNRCVKRPQKNFSGKKPSSKLSLKINSTTVVAAVMIPEVVNNWRSVLQINHLKKKLDFKPESSSVTGKVCYHYNSWVAGAYMGYMFDRNSGGKTSQIE